MRQLERLHSSQLRSRGDQYLTQKSGAENYDWRPQAFLGVMKSLRVEHKVPLPEWSWWSWGFSAWRGFRQTTCWGLGAWIGVAPSDPVFAVIPDTSMAACMSLSKPIPIVFNRTELVISSGPGIQQLLQSIRLLHRAHSASPQHRTDLVWGTRSVCSPGTEADGFAPKLVVKTGILKSHFYF